MRQTERSGTSPTPHRLCNEHCQTNTDRTREGHLDGRQCTTIVCKCLLVETTAVSVVAVQVRGCGMYYYYVDGTESVHHMVHHCAAVREWCVYVPYRWYLLYCKEGNWKRSGAGVQGKYVGWRSSVLGCSVLLYYLVSSTS